jgi:hypothetical protein
MNSKQVNRKHGCKNLENRVYDIDMFGSSVNFNFAGKQKITTTPGVLLTLIVIGTMMFFF